MMEGQNLGAEGQISDASQQIGDGSKMVGGSLDVVEAVADGRVKAELGSGGGEVVKRKRGRPPKALAKPPQPKPPPAKKIKEEEKKEEEDVCFICFDGGSLVLCDRRGCPKAYHPACIKRDEAFFESAAKWNCGWHICSICQKTAHHMCYTCTYSLCRGCIRKADYVCVRGDKGFCTVCMKTIMLIENNGQGEDGKVQADFDDKLSWEYLFKVYWVYLKGKLSLTLNELTEAKNPWKVATELSSVLPSTDVNHIPNDLMNKISATSIDNSEANECKRRKLDEQINTQKETVNMEKPEKDESASMEWATKELLDFVAHMKDGNTSVLSRFDVQALMMEYINRNNLRDPKRKNQIICDSRLKSLFGKPRVGHIQMLKLLEYHFLVKEDSQKKRANRTVINRTVVNRTAVQVDPDWSSDNLLTVGRDKKRKNCSKGVERVLQNKLDEFAAVDIHNINLVYLRRDLMENLLDDGDNFHGKVVGSIVRIRIAGCDLKHDMYRLVQVVGTSKVDVPYKINSKSTDIMLEVLNLDKKETISIDAISDQEFSEEECRRLQRSIRCGLVEHFTVGQIQEKAVALQSIKLNDWIEREILRLNHLRDVASEKGHKKSYRECVEKLQLLKTPEERERRLNEIPGVHSDPKMNPDYESDDTEEYFNKEHGDHMESKYSGISSKNSRSPKRRSRKDEKPVNQRVTTSPNIEEESTKPPTPKRRSRKDEKPVNQRVTTSLNFEEESTKPPTVGIDLEKDASVSTLEKSQHEIDCNGSTITKLEPQATLSTSVSNSAPETVASKITSVPNEPILWHYLDPNGKVQGPFSLVQLQRWSTTGYFPTDMRIWSNHEDESLLLNDVLKEHFNNYQNVTASATITAIATATATATSTSTAAAAAGAGAGAANKQIEVPNVCSEIPSSTVVVTQNPVNNEKLSDSQLGQNWSGNNNNNNNNVNYNPPSVESTVQLETSNMTQETEKNEADTKHAPATTLVELPGPSPKKMQSVLDSKALVQDSGNPPSWSTTASSLVAGEPKLPVSGNGWGGGCSSTPVKREEWDSGLVLEVAGDHVATPTSNIDQNVNPSQPACNDFTTWHGMGEMIEFSTLAEESVSDLLAEVDAMESQYGLPSPTSRRNSFVDDLFNGSFDEFSPTPDQGTRSDGFSSSGDIQLPCQSTTTTTTTPDEHPSINAFDFMKTSNGLHQHSFISPEINCQTQTTGVSQKTNSGNMGFKWPEMERASQGMIDINRSAKAEGDEGETETKTSDVKMESGNYNIHQPVTTVDNGILHNLESSGELRSGEHVKEMRVPKTIGIGAKLVTRVAQIKGLESTTNHRRVGGVPAKEEEDGEFIPPQPQPPPRAPPLTLGLDPYDPCDLGSETFQDKFNRSGQGTNMVRVGNIGWDSNQRKYGGERYNSSSSSSPRERSHQVEESGYSRSSRSSWNKQSSLGSGSGSGGGFSKLPPSKGQRVCRFYESGRCKKGASCKYLHPSP